MQQTIDVRRARLGNPLAWYLAIPVLALALSFLAHFTPAYGIEDNISDLSKFRGTVTYTFDTRNNNGGIFEYRCGKGKISKVRSSNEEVAFARYFDDEGMLFVYVEGPGRAVITYTYKNKTYAVNVVVKKYKNPLKKFKIGSKNYASRFKRDTVVRVNGTNVKGKRVKIVPAAGWKLKSIRYVNRKSRFKRIKNGSRFPSSAVGRDPYSGKLGSSIFAVLQNKSDGRLTEVWIHFQS